MHASTEIDQELERDPEKNIHVGDTKNLTYARHAVDSGKLNLFDNELTTKTLKTVLEHQGGLPFPKDAPMDQSTPIQKSKHNITFSNVQEARVFNTYIQGPTVTIGKAKESTHEEYQVVPPGTPVPDKVRTVIITDSYNHIHISPSTPDTSALDIKKKSQPAQAIVTTFEETVCLDRLTDSNIKGEIEKKLSGTVIFSMNTLDIRFNNITKDGARVLVKEILAKSKNLHTLKIENSGLTTRGLEVLLKKDSKKNLIGGFRNITCLSLAGNQFRTDGIAVLATAFKSQHILTSLDLSNNELDNTAINKLSEGIKESKTLTHLYLANNNIKTCKKLLAAVSLQVLDVRENELNDEAVQELSKEIKSLKKIKQSSLTALMVTSTKKIRDTVLQELKTSLSLK